MFPVADLQHLSRGQAFEPGKYWKRLFHEVWATGLLVHLISASVVAVVDMPVSDFSEVNKAHFIVLYVFCYQDIIFGT